MTPPAEEGVARTVLRWADEDEARPEGPRGEERLVLEEGPGGIDAKGELTVRRGSGGVGSLTYRLRADAGWRARRIEVHRGDTGLDLVGDGEGGWRDAAGRTLGEGAGCVDVDLAWTPFTNSLPIRRLGLAVGQAAEIAALHVGEGLGLSRAPQRYTRLDGSRYLYEGLGTGARAEIEVDDSGFVTTYPGAFRRVAWRGGAAPTGPL